MELRLLLMGGGNLGLETYFLRYRGIFGGLRWTTRRGSGTSHDRSVVEVEWEGSSASRGLYPSSAFPALLSPINEVPRSSFSFVPRRQKRGFAPPATYEGLNQFDQLFIMLTVLNGLDGIRLIFYVKSKAGPEGLGHNCVRVHRRQRPEWILHLKRNSTVIRTF